jgi:hypothetical protein
MGLRDDEFEPIDEYEELWENVLDQAVVNNSRTLGSGGGEQLSVQPIVGTTATESSIREKYSRALLAARSPEEFDAQVKMFKVELNAKQVTPGNFEEPKSETPITDSSLYKGIGDVPFLSNPDLTKSFVDKVHYKFEVNIGTSIALVPSEISGWEADNGFYLSPDAFGIDRKFKNGIMVSEDVGKVFELKDALEAAAHDAFTELVGTEINPFTGTQGSNKPSKIIFTNTKPVSYAIKLTSSSDNTFLVAPKDHLTGPIEFGGVSYKLRVPFFDMSANADIYSGGWTTVGGPYDYSISGLSAFSFPEFIGKIASPDPKTDAKVINLLALIVGVGDSAANSYHPAPIQILIQQKDEESCLIVQAGVGSNVFQTFAGKTVEGPVDNKYFRVTLDAQHSDDPFTHFVSVDENGNFVFTRKLYSGDKIEEYVDGSWNDCTAKYLMKSVQASDNVLFRRIDEKLSTVIKPIPKIYSL